MKDLRLGFRTKMPDLSGAPRQEFDWSESMYSKTEEPTPKAAPKPLGNPVVTVSYVDANLMHDVLTGKSVTGILHFINKTPFDWYSK